MPAVCGSFSRSFAGWTRRHGFDIAKDVKIIAFAQAAMLMFLGLAQFVSGQNAPSAAATGRHKVQVNDRALGQKMAAGGARLIADYGGYQLYDAPDSMTHFPADKAELRDDYNLILLNASRLDTTQAEVKALRKTAGGFAGKRMHLVQFAGPIQPDWRQALLDAGAQIVSYLPHNTYLIYGDAAAIARVQTMAAAAPHVQWEGAYLDGYKIHPSAKPRTVKIDQFAIQLMSDDAVNAGTLKLIEQLRLAPLTRQRRVLNFVDVVVRVAPGNLAQIAARPDVISIQPYETPRQLCERQDQIVAGNLSGNAPSGPGYLAWLQSHGFTQSQFDASGFIVDVSDSGIDDGTTHPNHFGFYTAGDTARASRVVYNRLEGTPNPFSTLAGCDGHGNINAHIVGGYDDRSGFPFADTSGYHYGLGVCPFAMLGSSVIFDPTNFTNPSYEDLMSQAYADGARVSNNSWGDGANEDGLYNLDSQEYDALVRDAQPEGSAYAAPGNQEMVILFAAGNDGPTTESVSPPATGKNIIAVGAAQNVQSFPGADDGADLGGTTDSQADNANAIVDFSSRGPCADLRQKPDLVAPGTHVSGGVTQAANPGPDGTADPCFLDIGTNSIRVDGGSDGSIFFPDTGQQFYTASSGTSHSTPCVAGGCALVRQYFINQGWTPPSPAMTKAWLINAARYLNGPEADDSLWSGAQGMGEMDLGAAFDGTPRLLRDEAPGDMFTASGQTRVFTGVIANAQAPFRVTAAWTDAPGSTTGAAYNNDLDLTVTVGGRSYKGNVFNGAFSITGGSADPYNNVESVFLPAGVSGNFTVTLTAASINSVGVPGAAGLVNQDFALIVYNAGPAPVLAAGGAALTLETCLPTNGVIDPGETVTVDLTIQNAGSTSTTNLVATLLAGNGIAFPSGPQTYGALAPGSAGTAAYSFEAVGVCGGVITATLQLQDGAANLGSVSYNFQLGKFVTITNFTGNFGVVIPPSLPAGWTSSDTDGAIVWTTENGVSDTGSNAVYCPDAGFADAVFLVSPEIMLPSGPSQLSFHQKFNLEDQFDGGVLQINIGGAGFMDIEAAGGSFVQGGYVEPILSDNEPGCTDDPLTGQYAWSGTSDGFMTTVVNLPPGAQGQSIKLRWYCGTDCQNFFLFGLGGWWIDNIAITQTNWACCTSMASAVPIILFPANGYQSTVAAAEVVGTTASGASLTLYDNGSSNETITADAAGLFNAPATLSGGTNVLFLTQNGTTNSSSPVTVVLLPTAPTLIVAAKSSSAVAVSGSGLAGAVVNLLTNGVLAASLTNNAAGNYIGLVTFPDGAYSMSATETVDGLTSSPSAATSVTVVTVSAPVILSPPSELTTNTSSLTVTGTGVSGATVFVYDGTNLLGTNTVNKSGKFSLAVKNLSNGAHPLTALETSGGISSVAGAPVTVTLILTPVITAQPQGLTGFLKETVKFSTGAYGAAPLRYAWVKNGVKIPGADATNLTLAGLVSNSAASYQMIAANSYGSATSLVAVLALTPNPFVNLTGTYDGLFAQSNAQFESSGFLKLTLGPLGSFSANILNAGGSYSFSGAFSVAGQALVPVSRGADAAPLMVDMNLDLTTNEQILGVVSNAAWSAPLQAGRATFGATNEFLAHGKFTMLFVNGSDGSESPGGDGYGSVSISKDGMATWSGLLSDNTSVAPPAVSISKFGQWPLYIPLYGKLGSLSGWITNVGAGGTFAGEANWFRVGASGKLYRAGFTNTLAIAGSAFTPGTAKIPVLAPGNNLFLTLSGAGLSPPLTNALTLFDSGQFVTNTAGIQKLTLSVAPGTGVISGSFLDPLTRLTTTLKGAVLQQQGYAAGFFLGTNATGSFLLYP
jgi:hypothetical protein